MFLHLNHHDVVYADRRRSDEAAAAHRRLAKVARRATDGATTLGSLLDEAGAGLAEVSLDGRDPRQVVIVEALVAQLVSAAAEHDGTAAALAPRDGEPPVVAVRTVAVLSRRGAIRGAPVSAWRSAAVRDLLRQLGAEPTRRSGWSAVGARRPRRARPAAATPPAPASAPTDEGCTSLSA